MAVRRFAKLAIVAVFLSVVAVPVTCADAHGPHSLYAPPDAQASAAASTLATHHHGHHSEPGSGSPLTMVPAWKDASARPEAPVLTTVNPGYLLLDQQATPPWSEELQTLTDDTHVGALPAPAALTGRSDHPEAPPPR